MFFPMATPPKACWLVKQEPEKYSWEQFLKDQKTLWDGVRNFQARNNLRAMKKGDLVFFYRSVTEPAVVGPADNRILGLIKKVLPGLSITAGLLKEMYLQSLTS